MPTPPPPASGAEVDTFTITNTVVPANGIFDIDISNFADKNNANDVTIDNVATDTITEITIKNLGGNDNKQDVIRFDLSEYEDNFAIILENTGTTVKDFLFLEGVHRYTDNGDGTFQVSYYGSDSQLHFIQVTPQNATINFYYAPDGIVDGSEGADTIDVDDEDFQGDIVDGADGDDDAITGYGGTDSINGGDGADTIFGDYDTFDGLLTPDLPDRAFTGTPAGPASGATVHTRTLNNTIIDNNGQAKIAIDSFANKNLANDVTVADGGTDDLNLLIIEKGGDGDGEADVFRLDLSGYNDDFDIELKNTDEFDKLVLTNVHTIDENGDGTWKVTYYGSDAQLHTIGSIILHEATIEAYVNGDSPYFFDDTIDGGAGDDEIDGGFGDDSIAGGADNDTIIGGVGLDSIDGGTGDDVIYGDWDAPLTPEAAPGTPDTTVDGTDWTPSSGVWAADISDVEDPADADHILFQDNGTFTGLSQITVSGFDDSGEDDIIHFDLSTFNDDFHIHLASKGEANDTVYLEGVYSSEYDEDTLTWTATYYGSDGALHTVTLDPGDSAVETFFGPPPDSVFYDDNDTILGGAGDDTIYGGFGDDSIDAGADDDSVYGGLGDDTILGDTGNDSLDGGLGDDSIQGGTGSDTLYGGDGEAPIPLERVAFKWSNIPDPDDGGQIDNLDAVTSGSQTVGGTTVDFTVTGGAGQYETTTVYTSGIDAGTGSVDSNSALGLDGADGVLTMDFSTPVENLHFRINDFEANSETIFIQAYDADNNLIPFSVTQGSGVNGSDTDTISGNDTFQGPLSNTGDNSVTGSILVDIAGPVARIVIDYDQTNGSLTMTDVHFDDPATGTGSIGDDDLDGGDGDDFFFAGLGTDTITGGAGTDTYDASFSDDLTDETITVTLNQSGTGTAAKTTDATTDTLSSIERIIAAEAAAENDEITLTGVESAKQITGISDNAVGVFYSTDTLQSYFFGGPGEPTINEIFAGNFNPGTGLVKPNGNFRITSGEEDGAQIGSFYVENFETMDFNTVACFTPGTLIETARGPVPIETLQAGDRVRTMDHGLQPIRWIGSTNVPAIGKLAPVRILAGALGNDRDLLVSPQHRMLLSGWQAELCFGEPEVFASAQSLINGHSVTRDLGGNVTYIHMLFDRHEIVFAEGAPSESFHPGKIGMEGLSPSNRAEIVALFPELEHGCSTEWETARLCLRSYESAVLSSYLGNLNRPCAQVALRAAA